MNYTRMKRLYKKNNDCILPIKEGQFLELRENVGQGDNKRVSRFKGTVLKVKKSNHSDGTFLIRGEVARTIVEKIYPLSFKNFEKVLLLDEYKTRRSKLYYLRDKVGKGAKMTSLLGQNKSVVDLLELARKKLEEEKKEEIKEEEKKEEIKEEEKKEEIKEEEKKEEKKEEEKKEEKKEEEKKEEKREEEKKEEKKEEEKKEEEKK